MFLPHQQSNGGQYLVEVEPSLAVKALLHIELLTQHVRPSELARRVKLDRQDVNRLLNPRHATKVSTMAAAFGVLGKSLESNVKLTTRQTRSEESGCEASRGSSCLVDQHTRHAIADAAEHFIHAGAGERCMLGRGNRHSAVAA